MIELSNAWVSIACLWVAYLVYGIIWRLYLSPIAQFPGSKWAALTLWYEFYFEIIKRGKYFQEIERMHSVYGPIVRISPYEIHVKDPDWYDELYTSSNRRRDKSAWHVGPTGGDSIFGTIPHEHHRLRRSALNPFFSKRSIIGIEPLVQDKVKKLCNAVERYIQSGKPLELQTAYMALTLDVISHYAFGESFELSEKEGFSPEWKKALLNVIESATVNRHLPWLADCLMLLPDSVAARLSKPIAFFLQVRKDVRKQVEKVLARKRDPLKAHKTIFEELRDSDLPAQEKTIERLVDDGFVLVTAGGETTAQTLAVLTFHLLNNPDILCELRTELDQAMPDAAVLECWQTLEQLPYLRAVITEAHRIAAVITARLIRIAPTENLRFQGRDIPAGTPISMTTHFINLDPTIFPDPHKFDPHRWLRNREERNRLEKYVIPFSKGSRACIGLHLANCELYLVLAAMIRRFDLELYETSERDIEITWDAFAGRFREESKGVRVRLTGVRE
ncbi:hypothetical protein GJ744_004099 [Endocarpon pusillum]|uniref:Trichodiene oxygenase n=1 Tax=Endocarpon pusillum TaxID=364733 RepID=A0A8H7E9A3_9EURO|nr:hypothetical protein GJ744_004099 [Endocarpon pusillum]